MRGVANVPDEIAIHEVAELPERPVWAAGLPATPAEKFNHAAHVDAGDVAPHVVVSACRWVKAERCVCVFFVGVVLFLVGVYKFLQDRDWQNFMHKFSQESDTTWCTNFS